MAKTEKELQDLKENAEELSKELKELSDEELDHIAGGDGVYKRCEIGYYFDLLCGYCRKKQ